MYYSEQVVDGQIVSVESKSVEALSPNFVRATEAEYDSFMASLPEITPEPLRNLATEIDSLKAGANEIRVKLKQAGIM